MKPELLRFGKYDGVSKPPPLFDHAAAYYPHRISYTPKFFDDVSTRLELNATSRLLDIACGTGELASGFAEYCGEIVGLDQSEKMLELARANVPENVSLVQLDINHSGTPEFGVFDTITIGRALRYLDRDPLFAFLAQTLKADGVILICGAGLASPTRWGNIYVQIMRQFQDMSKLMDLSWRGLFVDSSFQFCGKILSTEEKQFSIDDLVNNVLSYRALSETVRENIGDVTARLTMALQPFLDESNMLTGVVASYANQFRWREAP